jgi:hypothetical protein
MFCPLLSSPVKGPKAPARVRNALVLIAGAIPIGSRGKLGRKRAAPTPTCSPTAGGRGLTSGGAGCDSLTTNTARS